MKKTYALLSCTMVNTPGLLRWAQNGYHFKKDRKFLLRVFTDGYGGPTAPDAATFDRLLKGELPWVEEDGKVVFTVEA